MCIHTHTHTHTIGFYTYVHGYIHGTVRALTAQPFHHAASQSSTLSVSVPKWRCKSHIQTKETGMFLTQIKAGIKNVEQHFLSQYKITHYSLTYTFPFRSLSR